ncbi:NAD(P)/FAD-dependent oxidoreductase [Sulfuriflexus mobilis]|uniref:NAD(P)/FAD-dependent oxidoreductase n=1 Tax=Sulfuriflexus mobilis TaxID=1811807 RepID=UPI000F82C976|nr:NAD(P)/FAD-dependent oxidoreductase [Sulfuriflexus mobilis]
MNTMNRRKFIQLLGGSSVMLATLGPLAACSKPPATTGRVIVVGGGFGGATCAKYLHRFDPDLDITLVEPATRFVTCPFSNAVLSGMRDMDAISHGYTAQEKRGIKVVHAMVQEVDAPAHKLTLSNGQTLAYDRLVLSPGIDFRWEAVEGMTAEDAQAIPHAWQGGSQTTLLHDQLTAMSDGGTVIIAPPGNPFRCPPGPYERVSLIAHYLKQHKPRSKILILDTKDKFSKQPLFMQGWQQLYPGMIEWVSGSQGGRIDEVDVATRTLFTESGDRHTGDVVNFIPPQKAAALVHKAGLTNNDGWCPVDQRTFESSLQADVHVIGDASIAGKMPKSGFAANSQGKVCAAAIVSALHGISMPEPSYVNTCYSLVSPDYGISVAAVYRYSEEKGIYAVEGSGGVSPKDADAAFRQQEARYAAGWYDSITSDTFG